MRISEIVWGDDSAEKDPDLLSYFVDSDSFQRLKSKTKSIVVGRKGAGKSALRKKLEQEFTLDPESHVINIAPKYASIRNVLNDWDLNQTFGEEIFFQHTWLRHIFMDCLCKIGDSAKGKFAKESIEFARNISVRMNRTSKDLVENISDVLAKVKLKVGNLGDFGLQLEKELRNYADVDALEHHVKKLASEGAKFIVLFDDLDLGWDNSKTANNLLLGLLSAANHLSTFQNIYCCIFLREDVYTILVRQTKHSDKYRNVERIRWTNESLKKILTRRINFNRSKFGLPQIDDSFHSVFPAKVGRSKSDKWLIDRTLSRPRELLQLVRYYTENVLDETPDKKKLKECESTYSSWKLDDLCSEYSNQYPGLINIFSYWKTNFFRYKYRLKRDEIENMLLKLSGDIALNEDWFTTIVNQTDIEKLINILYEIGFIGDFVKGGEGGSKVFYSHFEMHNPILNEVRIHPCFRKSVNTVGRIRAKTSSEKIDEDEDDIDEEEED